MYQLLDNDQVIAEAAAPFRKEATSYPDHYMWVSGNIYAYGNGQISQRWNGEPDDCPDPNYLKGGKRKQRFISVMDFKLSFFPQERVAINELRKADPVLDDFYSILDDPRCTRIDLNLPSIQMAIRSFIGRIDDFDENRADQVIAGQLV